MSYYPSQTATGGGAVDSLMDAVKRAEAERDNLQAQLTLIFEQTKTQREKIHELQDVLLDKTIQLESTEDLLREVRFRRIEKITRFLKNSKGGVLPFKNKIP
jgi:hypothetical protein